MDQNKIKVLCNQILAALEVVCVAGEVNQAQLVGVRRAVREIAKEASQEVTNG